MKNVSEPRALFARASGSFALVATIALLGCSSPITLVHQATPNPLRRGHVFAIEPIEFDETLVGDYTEPNWLARRSPAQRASWDADKDALSRRFAARLIGRGEQLEFRTASRADDDDAVVIRTRVEWLEPGFFVMPYIHRDTSLRLDVQLVAHGVPFEEFLLRTSVRACLTHATSGSRMRSAGDQIADRVYAYLRTRTRT